MIHIYRTVYEEMKSALLRYTPERGGILGAKQGEPISKFYFDESGVSTPDSYTPDYEAINAILEKWEKEDIIMVGIAHSHADDDWMPSCGDLYYCERILLANPMLDQMILPIASVEAGKVDVFVCSLKNRRVEVVKDCWELE